MDRLALAELLKSDRRAFLLCGTALSGGADFKIWNDPIPTRELGSIYSRRMRMMHRKGQITIGATEAIADLEACPETELMIGRVDDRPNSGYIFQIFLTPSLDKVVSCLAVQPPPTDTLEPA
ncbi:hypothetical protein [Nocardiopsis trehalosi]|uniref:hypothetical protein n=1 Tax=Nocardiopsis trehalosi TaxID=109329 RepID=UPI000AB3C3DD|nr:hypothetical protein [Nocardiopsis trehalosi]